MQCISGMRGELSQFVVRRKALLPWRGNLAGGYDEAMRFRLRTLLIVLAIGPPVLAAIWLWILPLTPTSFGDAVLIGFREGTAVLLLCALLQSGLAAVISLQNHSTINR